MTAPVYKVRVWEVGTVTGTGTVTLPGSAATGGYQTFYSALGSTACTVAYSIVDTATAAWEVGTGTFNGANPGTLTRSFTESSTGAALSFAGNTCNIEIVILSPVTASAGSSSAGAVPALNGNGALDASFLVVENAKSSKHLGYGRQRWGLLGDSFQAFSSAPSYFGTTPNGVLPSSGGGYNAHCLPWLNVLTNNSFFFDGLLDNYGTGGGTIETMLTNLPYIIARNCQVVVVGGPHNDSCNGTAASVWQANYAILIGEILAAGIIPVLVLDPPMGAVPFGSLTLAQLRAAIIGNNLWIKNFAMNNGLLTWDWFTPMINSADSLGGALPGTEQPDNVHPSSYGAFLIALQGLKDLAPILGSGTYGLAVAQNDIYDATYNPYGNLIGNPLFLSTTTPGSPAPYTTLTQPTGWGFFTLGTIGSGKVLTGSVVANPNGNGNLFETVFSGTQVQGNSQSILQLQNNVFGVNAGLVEGYVFVTVAANSPFSAIKVYTTCGGVTMSNMGPVEVVGNSGPQAWSGVIYVPPLNVAANNSLVEFVVQFIYDDSTATGANGTFAGTVSIGQPAMRYVPAAYGVPGP